MRRHHTKNKGDLGLLHAQLDLAEKGFGVLVPLTEHEAFDLVAYRADRFYLRMDKSSVDLVCVYCPDTRRCYYIDPRRHGNSVTLRITPTRNGQSKGVLLAERFTEIPEAP